MDKGLDHANTLAPIILKSPQNNGKDAEDAYFSASPLIGKDLIGEGGYLTAKNDY